MNAFEDTRPLRRGGADSPWPFARQAVATLVVAGIAGLVLVALDPWGLTQWVLR